MIYAIDLTYRYPELATILQHAARGGDWVTMARYRADIRSLGLVGTDLAVALGLLDDAVGAANVTPVVREVRAA